MRVFITGDTHGDLDIHKLTTNCFPTQKELTKEDIVIICGDSGLCWDGNNQDRYLQKWYENKNFTTLSILGNHENYDLVEQLPIVDFYGGKAYQVSKTVFYAINGEIYNLNGGRFFCFGGAVSTDKMYRKEGVNWWPQEVPNIKQRTYGDDNLAKVNDKVDYILTHCGPKEIVRDQLRFKTDELNSYLSYVLDKVDFKEWFMGHYHVDMDFDNIHLLYDRVIEI